MVRWKSKSHRLNAPPLRSRTRRPIRSAAAQCDLDGPRIPGPITSLNRFASMSSAFQLSQTVNVKSGDRGNA
jgi:hypothetical protein